LGFGKNITAIATPFAREPHPGNGPTKSLGQSLGFGTGIVQSMHCAIALSGGAKEPDKSKAAKVEIIWIFLCELLAGNADQLRRWEFFFVPFDRLLNPWIPLVVNLFRQAAGEQLAVEVPIDRAID
jgi:hypothetical protein